MLTVSVAKTGGNGCRLVPNIHFSAAWKTVESPIVTMITEMIGSPIIGRSTQTCSATPKTSMNTSVIGMPSQNGSWYLVSSHQQHHAPISRNSPCAKFTTCVAL